MRFEYPYLFTETQLPIPIQMIRPKRSYNVSVKKNVPVPVQLDIWSLLSKPILKGKKAGKSVQVEWDDVKTFAGSITINQLRAGSTTDGVTDWKTFQLMALHHWVLNESMEALKEEGNPEEKMDILEWIFSPSYIDKLSKTFDGKPCLIRRHVIDIPFSFANCCRVAGITDFDSFRESLVEHMSDEFRPKLDKYLVSFTGKRIKKENTCKL